MNVWLIIIAIAFGAIIGGGAALLLVAACKTGADHELQSQCYYLAQRLRECEQREGE